MPALSPLLGNINSEEIMRLVWGLMFPMIVIGLPLIVLVLSAISSVVNGVAKHSRRKLLDEMEATLKMEMIQRGMSADEIATVLAARMSASNEMPSWKASRRERRKARHSWC